MWRCCPISRDTFSGRLVSTPQDGAIPSLGLGSCGPGKLTEKGKVPKVLRGGCKRSFGPREQRSPKSLLHHPKLLLHRCKMGLHRCKRLFGDLCSLGPKDLLHPPLSTFGTFPFSVSFPGPQLPNPWHLVFHTNTSVRYPILRHIARQLCDTPWERLGPLQDRKTQQPSK